MFQFQKKVKSKQLLENNMKIKFLEGILRRRNIYGSTRGYTREMYTGEFPAEKFLKRNF